MRSVGQLVIHSDPAGLRVFADGEAFVSREELLEVARERDRVAEELDKARKGFELLMAETPQRRNDIKEHFNRHSYFTELVATPGVPLESATAVADSTEVASWSPGCALKPTIAQLKGYWRRCIEQYRGGPLMDTMLGSAERRAGMATQLECCLRELEQVAATDETKTPDEIVAPGSVAALSAACRMIFGHRPSTSERLDTGEWTASVCIDSSLSLSAHHVGPTEKVALAGLIRYALAGFISKLTEDA